VVFNTIITVVKQLIIKNKTAKTLSNKKALKKYNEKLEKKRINFCIYCNGKIDGLEEIEDLIIDKN